MAVTKAAAVDIGSAAPAVVRDADPFCYLHSTDWWPSWPHPDIFDITDGTLPVGGQTECRG